MARGSSKAGFHFSMDGSSGGREWPQSIAGQLEGLRLISVTVAVTSLCGSRCAWTCGWSAVGRGRLLDPGAAFLCLARSILVSILVSLLPALPRHGSPTPFPRPLSPYSPGHAHAPVRGVEQSCIPVSSPSLSHLAERAVLMLVLWSPAGTPTTTWSAKNSRCSPRPDSTWIRS